MSDPRPSKTSEFSAPIAEQIWDMKYRLHGPDGQPIDRTVHDTWNRIAEHLAQAEDPKSRSRYAKQFYEVLKDFKFLPAGRIIAGAGTARNVTLFNCFVMGKIPDSMDGIFSSLREAALTMQAGGGIGYDFSPLRPRGAPVKGVGADASGPLTFMDVWDSMCRTVMSAGSRRGAMMATMRCDHPDIEDFITAKHDPNRLRMFNMSVLVTDEFMEAVENDSDWLLYFDDRHGKRLAERTVKARDLWDKIMRSTYETAEPGVIFIDRVNQENNLSYCESISASNPCGEQMLPPYGACLLGSINLAKFISDPFTDDARIDTEGLRETVHIAVRMLDNVVDVSKFPLDQQVEEARAKRRIGLGVTGLADALAMLKIKYGSPRAIEATNEIMELVSIHAYDASIDLAKQKGSFPLFDADQYLSEGHFASRLPEHTIQRIRKNGIRNALLTSIAPTGTISLYAGNVSSGIEPIFATSYTRKVLQPDGTKAEETVEDYAVTLFRQMWEDQNPDAAWDPSFLPDYFVTAQTLSPEDHIVMQAAAQAHVDNSISKTINCPVDIDFEDFKSVYQRAYESGCKGCTTYRPNEITGSVLSVENSEGKSENEPSTGSIGIVASPDSPPLSQEAVKALEVGGSDLPRRPERLEGATYKIKVGDQKAVYLTINNTVESDGTVRPFEIFLRSSDPTHDEWMVALARMISAIFRRPHNSEFVGRELKRIASPVSGGFQPGGGFQPSLVAAIGSKIEEHMNRLSGASKPPEERTMAEIRAVGFEPYRATPCPKCAGYNTKNENGCLTCLDCGHSKCG